MYPYGFKSEALPEVEQTVSETFKLCIDVSKTADAEKEQKIIKYLTNIVAGGNEISTDAGSYITPSYTAILALAKANSRIWNELTAETKDKLDLLARCLLVATAAIASDQNRTFYAGLSLRNQTNATWSQNIRISLASPFIFLKHFLEELSTDGTTVVSILENFDFDTYLADIRAAGFTNIEKVWTSVIATPTGQLSTRDLLMYVPQTAEDSMEVKTVDSEGNITNRGTFGGIKRPFMFGLAEDAVRGMFWMLVDHTFRCREITNTYTVDDTLCYIIDGTESPYVGRKGSPVDYDYQNYRGSARYAIISICMLIECLRAMLALGILDWQDHGIANDPNTYSRYYIRMYVGAQDAFYRLDHGYHGYNLCVETTETYENVIQNFPQVETDREIWNELVGIYGDPGDVHPVDRTNEH